MRIDIIYYVYRHYKEGKTTQLELLNQQGVITSKDNPFASFPVKKKSTDHIIIQHAKSFETTLQHIFPEKQEETRIQKARLIMGDDVKDLSDEDLDVYLTEFQYLIDCWLDEYEKKVFNNKTLKEKLMEV